MAETNPNVPGGAVPPKPGEAAKVQPKKETVRISLPPKPASSPTIKLPTLPGGAPASSPGGATVSGPAPSAAGAPPPPPPRPPTAAAPAPAARPPTSTGSAVSRPGPLPSSPGPALRQAPAVTVRKASKLDVGLGIAAAVIGLGAVVSLALLLNLK